jgi:hypothetical protein
MNIDGRFETDSLTIQQGTADIHEGITFRSNSS